MKTVRKIEIEPQQKSDKSMKIIMTAFETEDFNEIYLHL